MKKLLYTLAFIFTMSFSGYGQNIWSFNYNVGVPVGDFSNYIDQASWRGFGISGASYITDNITIGGTFNWQGYGQQEARSTYSEPGRDLTAQVWKRMYITTLALDANYVFMSGGNVQPYAGLGFGPYYVQQETQPGSYLIIDKTWKMALSPQVGVYLPFGASDWGAHVRARYDNVFYSVQNIKNLSQLSFSVGFVYIGF